jgi:hypothetical protein
MKKHSRDEVASILGFHFQMTHLEAMLLVCNVQIIKTNIGSIYY